jgi:hypothetical protein
LHRHIPLVLTLGGGYAKPISDTVRAHAGTYRVVKELFEREALRAEV